ncbi:hypothetical protein L1987_32538 [Smallanthus sonchifolius]|uniref:Uncharacterized protein n=1 Tax=Smallanthus sonchifolius TaxID=185202 RepID=A0ACB9HNU3_9ASTR|nr:hypothetical protein L1987_32538 [Smallanthus sonchifolius]
MDLIAKASSPRRWIVLFVEFGLKILPCGDRIVGKGVKPSRCATREREWEETQVDSLLRHTRDIEGMAGRVTEDLAPMTPSLALWYMVRVAGGSSSPILGNGTGLLERSWVLKSSFKRS